jgi:DNA-binding GntR family transcriptional regulator
MYATRRLVEPLGIEATMGDTARRAALRELVDSAQVAAEGDDWDTVGTADIDFHRRLMSACHSTHLSAMFEHLLAELRLAFLRLPDRRSLHEPYLRRNRRLVDLLEAGDLGGSLAELDDYLVAAERHLLQSVE